MHFHSAGKSDFHRGAEVHMFVDFLLVSGDAQAFRDEALVNVSSIVLRYSQNLLRIFTNV